MAQGKDILNFSTWIVQVRDAFSFFISHTHTHTRTHARTHTRTHARTYTHIHTKDGVNFERSRTDVKPVQEKLSLIRVTLSLNQRYSTGNSKCKNFFFTGNVEHVTVTANRKCLACKTELLHSILTVKLECFTSMGNAGPRKQSDCWCVSVIRTRYS